ncbi:MAG: hypothetical protein KGI38_01025 [Thaumarchaeota archaeon]|nr:hypothetical protein [Nitrososphaerota archaeon]
MVSKGAFYGIVVTLIALLLISSTFAVIYLNEYQLEVSANQTHTNELDLALSSYRSLSGLYNISLSEDYNTLSLLATAVANLNTSTPAYQTAASALSSLWAKYQALAGANGGKALAYEVHMLVDFGNGTRKWYNDTAVQPGWNGYVVTLVLMDGNVQAVWYPQYGEHFVTGLGGVSNTQTKYWFLLTYNKTASWQEAQVGADQIQVFNGTTFAWAYCPENSSYGPACPLP